MTGAGRGLLAASIVLVAAAYRLGYPELLVLGIAGLVVLGAGASFVVGRPDPLIERRVSPERVTVGEIAEGFVTVTNNGRRALPSALAQEAVAATRVELVVPRLRAGQAVTIPYRLPTGRRAVVTVGPLTLRRADPFGLWARVGDHGGQEQLWVHPQIHALAPLRQARRRDPEGLTEVSQGGDRIFHTLRDYVVGDDLRRVHWKATAHRGSLMVREHVDPAQPDTTVLLDDRADALDGDRFELAVEVAASVLLAAAGHGFPARLRTVSGRAAADVRATGTGALSAGDRLSALDVLAGVTRHDGDGERRRREQPAAELGLTREVAAAAGRSLVVVTGVPDEATMASLAMAARRADTVIVVAVVPPGVPAPTLAAPAGVTVLPVSDPSSLAAGWDAL